MSNYCGFVDLNLRFVRDVMSVFFGIMVILFFLKLGNLVLKFFVLDLWKVCFIWGWVGGGCRGYGFSDLVYFFLF